MNAQVGPMIVAVVIVVAVFSATWRNRVGRLSAVIQGAAAILAAGMIFGFYGPAQAVRSINTSTLILLLDMGILSAVLEEAGFFSLTARRLVKLTGHSSTRALVLSCLFTYLVSMWVNNLTTIMVIVPMTLKLAERLQLDPRPLVISEIISSNLGGASSMVGDFPNMLISSSVGLSFTTFLGRMMPPCLVLLGVLFFLMRRAARTDTCAGLAPVEENDISGIDLGAIGRALTVFAVEVVAYFFEDRLQMSPATTSIFGAFFLFFFGGVSRMAILKRVGYKDLLFFSALFVLVGGVSASGVLRLAAGAVGDLAGGSQILQCVLLMWLAAVVTAFLNAGPATALMLPIFLHTRPGPPHHLLWWALSLGVCAGSSATLIGATAGPVAASMVEKHFEKLSRLSSSRFALTSRNYAYLGVPVSLVFLLVSSAYILIVYVS